jgi:hypothetical protein
VTPLTKLSLSILLIVAAEYLAENATNWDSWCRACRASNPTTLAKKLNVVLSAMAWGAFWAGVVNLIVSAIVGAYRGGWL